MSSFQLLDVLLGLFTDNNTSYKVQLNLYLNKYSHSVNTIQMTPRCIEVNDNEVPTFTLHS